MVNGKCQGTLYLRGWNLKDPTGISSKDFIKCLRDQKWMQLWRKLHLASGLDVCSALRTDANDVLSTAIDIMDYARTKEIEKYGQIDTDADTDCRWKLCEISKLLINFQVLGVHNWLQQEKGHKLYVIGIHQ
jgi:hypothetical protein